MKKYLFFALLATTFMFNGCGDRYVTEEHYEGVPATKTISYKVLKPDWKVGFNDESGKYLYYTFDEPVLTGQIIKDGLVVAYMLINGNLTPLPFEDSWIDQNGYKWTEQVTCEIKAGEITFIFKANDHSLNPYHPDYTFVLKMMW
ncbi:MAG: hypothetical protein LBJ17_07850 [Dysgonamonadaceae bacterium]|jgi:hypothetical protein|nr:hypothetical protein [Dysgonamonadaceae bacterium]